MDLEAPAGEDGRRLEVVVDGLPLFGGAQLAVDATLVSALRRDGSARPGAADTDGVALDAARRRKEGTYPELTGAGGRARLVVIGGEVGGRWFREIMTFLRLLALNVRHSGPSNAILPMASCRANFSGCALRNLTEYSEWSRVR